MNESGLTIDSIEGSNPSLIMRTFVKSCKKNPPIHRNGSQPYNDKTVTKAFSAGIRKLMHKFREQIGDKDKDKSGDYFPVEEQDSCWQQLKRDRSRNLMEGVDDSDQRSTGRNGGGDFETEHQNEYTPGASGLCGNCWTKYRSCMDGSTLDPGATTNDK